MERGTFRLGFEILDSAGSDNAPMLFAASDAIVKSMKNINNENNSFTNLQTHESDSSVTILGASSSEQDLK